ncbi:hypothetical protein JR316_0006868 [Psilocybe cubensis]|uniref:Uncharacterized protein n=1 Tax=Psilocybe cubensis TaxID=181762 RepID=A0ACB8GXQ9_PSICU|nr:hypothetical protein JR316_0006868 [Psilocybe cubensis]KAH9480270.1 hypothetical protein JR316_0006868 [Psilocybe cubensis]
MPPELVYKILDDIPLAYLLQLICDQDIPHLEHCITSHLVLGKVFSVKYLAEIKALYSLYLRVCYLVYGYYPLYMDSLRFDGRSFTKAHHDLLEEEWGVASLRLQDFFRSAIRASTVKILYAYEYSLPVLTHYAPRTIGPKSSWEVTSVDSLREIFENLDAAEMKLNSIKFAQLNRMAAIVQTYPAMVRTLRDLGQDHHRNDQHLIDMLLRRARDMQKRQIAKQRIVAKCVFHTRRLYLVPHDRLEEWFCIKATGVADSSFMQITQIILEDTGKVSIEGC